MFKIQEEQAPKEKKNQNKKEIATAKSDRVKGIFAMLSWDTFELMKSRQMR